MQSRHPKSSSTGPKIPKLGMRRSGGSALSQNEKWYQNQVDSNYEHLSMIRKTRVKSGFLVKDNDQLIQTIKEEMESTLDELDNLDNGVKEESIK